MLIYVNRFLNVKFYVHKKVIKYKVEAKIRSRHMAIRKWAIFRHLQSIKKKSKFIPNFLKCLQWGGRFIPIYFSEDGDPTRQAAIKKSVIDCKVK